MLVYFYLLGWSIHLACVLFRIYTWMFSSPFFFFFGNLRILLANFFVLVLLWTYRILSYFLLEYKVRCFDRLFVRTMCFPFQGVFIVLVRTTYVPLRNSTVSLLFEDDVFPFKEFLSSWLGRHLLLSTNNMHPLKVSYCLFFFWWGRCTSI